MGRRKSSKPKRPSSKNRGGLSKKQYTTLKRDATNARRRIINFLKRDDSSKYTVPLASDYTISKLIKRIEKGETVKAITSELRSITANNIIDANRAKKKRDFKISKSQSKELSELIKNANTNIRAAKSHFKYFKDIFPKEFKVKEVKDNIKSERGFKDALEDLALYTPDRLIPRAINDDGEVGTEAEATHYRNMLERENERRRRRKENFNPRESGGFFMSQSEYDTKEINIASLNMEQLRKKAMIWDEPARIQRADIFLTNYENALEGLEASFIMNGLYNDKVEEMFNFIHQTLSNMYGDLEAIDYISTRVPGIDITLISGILAGDVDFYEIYEAWKSVHDLF